MPVLEREEYIEQVYFFRALRERLIDGLPSQEILARIGEELLSTTKLPIAVSFLHIEMKGTGVMGPAMARISHYFTPFQAHVISQAENDIEPVSDGASPSRARARGQVQSGRARSRRLFSCFSSRRLRATAWATTRGWPQWRPTRFTPKTGKTTS